MSNVFEYLAIGDFCLFSDAGGVCLMTDSAVNALTDQPIDGCVTMTLPIEVALALGKALIEAAKKRSN